jgi:hypothetical protein
MAEFFLNDFLSRRFSESVPYQDETLTYLPDRYSEHRPVLALVPCDVRPSQAILLDDPPVGTGSVSCNSVFVLHLCHFLHQEELMEPEATVQNP